MALTENRSEVRYAHIKTFPIYPRSSHVKSILGRFKGFEFIGQHSKARADDDWDSQNQMEANRILI